MRASRSGATTAIGARPVAREVAFAGAVFVSAVFVGACASSAAAAAATVIRVIAAQRALTITRLLRGGWGRESFRFRNDSRPHYGTASPNASMLGPDATATS